MHGGRSLARALAFAGAIPLVLAATGAALSALPAADADALAWQALAAAASMALLAGAGASLSEQGLARRLGLGAGRLRGRRAALALLGLLGLSHATEGILRLAGLDASPALARFEDALGGLGPRALAFPLLVLALASASGEELLFRGFVQRGLERVASAPVAIALAAAAFGAAHADWAHGGAAFALGLYLGTLARAAGSIRIAIAAHALNNAVAVLETAFGVRLPESGPGAWAGMALGLAVAAVGLRGLQASVLRGFDRP
jgi:membrane protease YdiL (CAAX protease family)